MDSTLDAPSVTHPPSVVADAPFDAMYAERHRLAHREVCRQHAIGAAPSREADGASCRR